MLLYDTEALRSILDRGKDVADGPCALDERTSCKNNDGRNNSQNGTNNALFHFLSPFFRNPIVIDPLSIIIGKIVVFLLINCKLQ